MHPHSRLHLESGDTTSKGNVTPSSLTSKAGDMVLAEKGWHGRGGSRDSDGVGNKADGKETESFLDMVTVVGIPVKHGQQQSEQVLGQTLRSTGVSHRRDHQLHQQGQHRQQQHASNAHALHPGADAASAAVLRAWNSVGDGEATGEGDKTKPNPRGRERWHGSDGDALDGPVESKGILNLASASMTHSPRAEKRGRARESDREESGTFFYDPEQRRAPGVVEAMATTASRQDQGAPPPHTAVKAAFDRVPMHSSTIDRADATTSAATDTTTSGRTGGASFSMGISGMGMALPWRGSRRQGINNSSPAKVGDAVRGGAYRRRLRRTQVRNVHEVAGDNAGWPLSGYGDGQADGNGNDNGGDPCPSVHDVAQSDGAARKLDGGNDAVGRGVKITMFEGKRSSRAHHGNRGDECSERVECEKFMTLESKAAGAAGLNASDQSGQSMNFVAEEGTRIGNGTGEARRGYATVGWRPVGDNLANLKTRMEERHQQHSGVTVASARAGGGGGD